MVSLDRLDDLQREIYRGLCYDVASSSLDWADFQIFQSEMMDAKTGVPWPGSYIKSPLRFRVAIKAPYATSPAIF